MTSPELEAVRKQHAKLLEQSSTTDDISTEEIRNFLTLLSRTGSVTEDVDQRSLLRSLIRYWSSVVYNKTGGLPSVELAPSLPPDPFNVYTNAGDSGNHYVPSGFIGDFGAIEQTENWTDHPHSGMTCIRVAYSGKATQEKGYAGVFWQDPPHNWGTVPGGYDLSRFLKLSFWVRGQSGGEQIRFFAGGIQNRPYGDSLLPAIYANDAHWVALTTSWQLVTINLKGENLTHVISAFGWSTDNKVNPKGATFYLDDIVYSV